MDEESDAAYSETLQSRDVEERERRQTWSHTSDPDEDNESERRRALKETLEAQFAEGSSGKDGRVFPEHDETVFEKGRLTNRNRNTAINGEDETRLDD